MENKSGMYWEMPIITIGKFTIADMSDREDNDSVWIADIEVGDGGEFKKFQIEEVLKDFYEKNL